jgi:hypothetical protein
MRNVALTLAAERKTLLRCSSEITRPFRRGRAPGCRNRVRSGAGPERPRRAAGRQEGRARELLAPEVREAGPQTAVRRARYLGLEADQTLYGVKDRHSLPAEQHLSGERRSV